MTFLAGGEWRFFHYFFPLAADLSLILWCKALCSSSFPAAKDDLKFVCLGRELLSESLVFWDFSSSA